MRQVIESDICIIGSGITAAMVAEKVAEERDASIVVVEAGDDVPPLDERRGLRERYLAYGENPWPNDHIDGLSTHNMQSRSMQVGGMAMHWGGVTPRFSPEDFRIRSTYGIGEDWPITYGDLDPYYQQAEERLGVAGEAGPADLDPRGEPYPQPSLPLSYNLEILKQWGAEAGIPFWSQPSAKNSTPYRGRPECCRSDTCYPVCPVGAKYSPDFTWAALQKSGRVRLVTRTHVRRLILDEASDRIVAATAVDRDDPNGQVEFRASVFVLAAGYIWSPHLLLLSANNRFPDGLANRAGLVGRYMAGHRNVFAYAKLPAKLYPGINSSHSLVSKSFMRPEPQERYLRHDLRIWESTVGGQARLRSDNGDLLLGDDIIADWRARTERGSARLRAYYDVLPAIASSVTLSTDRQSDWGDPLPNLQFVDHDVSREAKGYSEATVAARLEDMVRVGGGTIISQGTSDFQDHPAGGCRMGTDASTGVCDSYGRTFDHDNLFVVGAPTCVTAGCANGTLTFAALSLRAAEAIGGSVG